MAEPETLLGFSKAYTPPTKSKEAKSGAARRNSIGGGLKLNIKRANSLKKEKVPGNGSKNTYAEYLRKVRGGGEVSK